MNHYNPKFHHRRSIRLKGYDYSQPGLYFITLCCQNRYPYFGKIENGEIHLNELGKIAFEEWLNTESVRDNVKLHSFVVMPNHFHAIIEILFSKKEQNSEVNLLDITFKSPSQTIGSIIRGYKGATAKKIKIFLGMGESNDEGKGENKGESKGEGKGELQFALTAPTTKIWQRDYYEHIIRNEEAYQKISEYIINNPKKWEEDKFYVT